MGQKINPRGFRLINNKSYLSNWYSNKVNYLNLIKEDKIIRNNINDNFKNFINISKIEINRANNSNYSNESTFIKIYFLHPKEKEINLILNKNYKNYLKKKDSSYLKLFNNNIFESTIFIIKKKIKSIIKNLELKLDKIFYIDTFFIENLFDDATLIAQYISNEIEKRMSFRKIITDVISKIQCTNNQGIKIQISGRLNGVDIARTEWKKYGKIPLHTLDAKIDYSQENAKTTYGVIGVKVWLFLPK
jgi:small subunit ribosomal protein S3